LTLILLLGKGTLELVDNTTAILSLNRGEPYAYFSLDSKEKEMQMSVYEKGSKCSLCGHENGVVIQDKEIEIEYQGLTSKVLFENVPYCSICEDFIMDDAAYKKWDRVYDDLRDKFHHNKAYKYVSPERRDKNTDSDSVYSCMNVDEDGSKCTLCGAENGVVVQDREVDIEYKGLTSKVTLENVEYCSLCDDFILHGEAYQKWEKAKDDLLSKFCLEKASRSESLIGIYHSADFDGLCSGFIIRHFFPNAKMIGYDYGQDFPWDEITENTVVIMADVSLPREGMERLNETCDHLFWIDHHESAIKENKGLRISGLREVGVAACELTWKYLRQNNEAVPKTVRMLGKYDVGDFSLPIVHFQYGMRMFHELQDVMSEYWDLLVLDSDSYFLRDVQASGKSACKCHLSYVSKVQSATCETVNFHGVKFHASNSPLAGTLMSQEVVDYDEYDGCMTYFRMSSGEWKVSIYTKSEDLNMAEIASSMGGGGHKKAAGFIVDTRTMMEILNDNYALSLQFRELLIDNITKAYEKARKKLIDGFKEQLNYDFEEYSMGDVNFKFFEKVDDFDIFGYKERDKDEVKVFAVHKSEDPSFESNRLWMETDLDGWIKKSDINSMDYRKITITLSRLRAMRQRKRSSVYNFPSDGPENGLSKEEIRKEKIEAFKKDLTEKRRQLKFKKLKRVETLDDLDLEDE
jgi:oligoribonuclease NrnB/cAMP/cGMP phosphodiesterase (DHH superfamily)